MELSRNRKSSSFLSDALKNKKNTTAESKIKAIYHTALSRPPTERELSLIKAHYGGSGNIRPMDILWALINSHEFKIKK